MATGERISRQKAIEIIGAFSELIDRDNTINRATICGSLRRGCKSVGDAEIVIIPNYPKNDCLNEHTLQHSLFQSDTGDEPYTRECTNLLWRTLDRLVEEKVIQKAIYTDKNGRETNRWGKKFRSVCLPNNPFKIELYTAQPYNYGAIVCIRTGPADFSKMMVTRLRDYGMFLDQGIVWKCGDYGNREMIGVSDEFMFFELCRLAYLKPQNR